MKRMICLFVGKFIVRGARRVEAFGLWIMNKYKRPYLGKHI